MPTLTIQIPGRPPVEHILREAATTLGRATGNTIALDNSSVSQSHAEIIQHGSDFFLHDLKSTNGTLLNGQSISEIRLRDGDVLKLGEVMAVFELRPNVVPVIPETNLATAPASKAEKADTAVLSAKAKTTLLRPVSPGADFILPTAPAKRTKTLALVLAIVALMVAGGVCFITWKFLSGGMTKPIPIAQSTTSKPAAIQNPSPPNAVAEIAAAASAPEPTDATEVPLPTAAATNALSQTETNNLPELLIILRSSDVSARRRAAQEISALGSNASSALINLRLALLQNSDLEVCAWLVIALVKNDNYDQASLSVLIKAMDHESLALRRQVCATLASIPHDQYRKVIAIDALKAAAADDKSEDIRKEALAALKQIAPEEIK